MVAKVSLRKLSRDERILLVYHYEGVSKYLKLQGTSRLYFLTWNQKQRESFSIFKGPVIWNEMRDTQDNYIQRKRNLQVLDLDHNGLKDVVLKYGRTSRTFGYFGQGRWVKLNKI